MKKSLMAIAMVGLIAATSAQAQITNPAPPAAPPAPQVRPAPVPQPVPEVFEQWEVICYQNPQGAQACRIQHVVRDKNKLPELAVTVQAPAKAGDLPVATVTPPGGILLARGLVLQVDTQAAVQIPIRLCLPSGCRADFTLIEALNGQLQKGTTLKVTMAAANGQAIIVDVPLAGYPKAYARLLEKTKR
jgi:invasion protein IalB